MKLPGSRRGAFLGLSFNVIGIWGLWSLYLRRIATLGEEDAMEGF